MADKTLDLVARILPAGMISGGKTSVTALDSIKKAAVAAGAAIAAAFTATKIIGAIKQFSTEAAREEMIMRQLSNAVLFAGGSYEKAKGQLAELFKETQKFTSYGDSEQAEILRTLIVLTGNYDKALRLFPTTIKLAETGMFDAGTAALMLAKAVDGNTMALTRYFPRLKESKDILADLTAELNRTAGTAGTFEQATARLQNAMGDVRETGGQLLNDFLSPFVIKLAEGAEGVRDFGEAMQYLKPPEEFMNFIKLFKEDAVLGALLKGGAGLAGKATRGDVWMLGQMGKAVTAPGTLLGDIMGAVQGAQQQAEVMKAWEQIKAWLEQYRTGVVGPPISAVGPGYWQEQKEVREWATPRPAVPIGTFGGMYGRMAPPSIWSMVQGAPKLPQAGVPLEAPPIVPSDIIERNKKAREDMMETIGEEFSSMMGDAIITAFDEGGGKALKAFGKQLRNNLIKNISDALFKGLGTAFGGGPLSILFGSGKL